MLNFMSVVYNFNIGCSFNESKLKQVIFFHLYIFLEVQYAIYHPLSDQMFSFGIIS